MTFHLCAGERFRTVYRTAPPREPTVRLARLPGAPARLQRPRRTGSLLVFVHEGKDRSKEEIRAIYRTVPVPYRTDGSDVARCRQHACEEARRPQPASLGFVPAVLRSCVLWLLAACIAAALRKSNRQASRDPCAARRPALEFATHCRSSREARPRRARPCATRPGGSPR